MRLSRVWLLSFVGFLALAILWSCAQPAFSGGDEVEHVVKGEAVIRGQWGGALQSVPGSPAPPLASQVTVHVPVVFRYQESTGVRFPSPARDIECYISSPKIPASCAPRPDEGPWPEARTATYLGGSPVLPYLLNGAPVALSPGPIGFYGSRLLTGATAAALMATAIAFAAARRRPFLLFGVLAFATPATIAAWGTVTSGPLEIASAALAWVMVALLADGGRRTSALLGTTALSISLLALARPISLIWASVVLVALVVLLTPRGALSVIRGRGAKAGAALVAFAFAGGLAWLFLDGTKVDPGWFLQAPTLASDHYRLVHSVGPRLSHVLANVLRDWEQAIGGLGSRSEYLSPGWVQIGWTALIAGVVASGVVVASRRRLAVMGGLTLILFGLPVIAQVATYPRTEAFWGGRYDLPVIAGIVILAAASLDRNRQRFPGLRRLLVVGMGAMAVMQLLTFFGTLRRYVVGVEGDLSPLRWGHGWHPPVSALLLLLLMTVAVALVYFGLWWAARRWMPRDEHLGEFDQPDDAQLAPSEA